MSIPSCTQASWCQRSEDVLATLTVLEKKSPIWDMFEIVADMYWITASFIRLFVLSDLSGNVKK